MSIDFPTITSGATSPETKSAPLGVARRSAIGRVNVRPVARGDIATLLRLCDEHAQRAARERTSFGPMRDDGRELMEALFDAPIRVWAWIADVDGVAVGYAGASAGCSLVERANYFQLESLFARPSAQAAEIERRLFLQVLRMARTLGCLNLQWRLPAAQVQRLHARLPVAAARTGSVHYVLPLVEDVAARGACGG